MYKKTSQGWVRAQLDLLRFSLALMVVIGHLSQPFFQASWPDLTGMAVFAVGGFFVLSGYTICMLTLSAEHFDIRQFFADRASRLLSVSVLALVLTAVADSISARLAPDYYHVNFGTGNLRQSVWALLLNLLLVSQCWGQSLSPLSNSPFWSLSYEAGFYAIWGAAMYFRRQRGSPLYMLALMLFLGPNIVLTLPLWLLGGVLFRIERGESNVLRWVVATVGLVGIVGAFFFLKGHQGPHGLSQFLVEGTRVAIHDVFQFLHVDPAKVTGRIIFGALFTFLMLIPCLLAGQWLNSVIPVPPMLSLALSKLADLTYPLYLIHFPLLVLARATASYNPSSNLSKTCVVAAIILLAHVVAKITHPIKLGMREAMHPMARKSPKTR